jgi:hypothetical protein
MMGLLILLADATHAATGAAQGTTPPQSAQAGSWFAFPVAVSLLSLTVAICAFSIAARNFYLSRFQHVRCTFATGMTQMTGSDESNTHFDVEVESWGLPIWDMKVVLEAEYRCEFGVPVYTTTLQLAPVGTLPNPMNAGQVAKFRATNAEIQKGDKVWNLNRTMGLSDLPAERVLLRVYGSAERCIRTYTRAAFGYSFVMLDAINRDEANKQAARFDSRPKRALHWARSKVRMAKRPFPMPSVINRTRVKSAKPPGAS